jgi:WD40 repeat protein
MKGHVGDVADLAWANGGENLISASVDSTCILWGISQNGKQHTRLQTFEAHKKFV